LGRFAVHTARPSRPTSSETNVVPASVQYVSFGFDNFDEFYGYWTMSQ